MLLTLCTIVRHSLLNAQARTQCTSWMLELCWLNQLPFVQGTRQMLWHSADDLPLHVQFDAQKEWQKWRFWCSEFHASFVGWWCICMNRLTLLFILDSLNQQLHQVVSQGIDLPGQTSVLLASSSVLPLSGLSMTVIMCVSWPSGSPDFDAIRRIRYDSWLGRVAHLQQTKTPARWQTLGSLL